MRHWPHALEPMLVACHLVRGKSDVHVAGFLAKDPVGMEKCEHASSVDIQVYATFRIEEVLYGAPKASAG